MVLIGGCLIFVCFAWRSIWGIMFCLAANFLGVVNSNFSFPPLEVNKVLNLVFGSEIVNISCDPLKLNLLHLLVATTSISSNLAFLKFTTQNCVWWQGSKANMILPRFLAKRPSCIHVWDNELVATHCNRLPWNWAASAASVQDSARSLKPILGWRMPRLQWSCFRMKMQPCRKRSRGCTSRCNNRVLAQIEPLRCDVVHILNLDKTLTQQTVNSYRPYQSGGQSLILARNASLVAD